MPLMLTNCVEKLSWEIFAINLSGLDSQADRPSQEALRALPAVEMETALRVLTVFKLVLSDSASGKTLSLLTAIIDLRMESQRLLASPSTMTAPKLFGAVSSLAELTATALHARLLTVAVEMDPANPAKDSSSLPLKLNLLSPSTAQISTTSRSLMEFTCLSLLDPPTLPEGLLTFAEPQVPRTLRLTLDLATGTSTLPTQSTTGSLWEATNATHRVTAATETLVVSALTQDTPISSREHVEDILATGLLIKYAVWFPTSVPPSTANSSYQHQTKDKLTGTSTLASVYPAATNQVLLRTAAVASTGMRRVSMFPHTLRPSNAKTETQFGTVR